MNPADLSVQPSSQPKPADNPREELHVQPSAPEQVYTWLRMEPSLTSAVLAKTEEELLGGLAALMRNKVEIENAVRRLAQVLTETGQAQKELERVRQQVRQAEDELATRMDEQQRVKEQLLESQALLRVRQEQAAEYRGVWTSLQADAERVRGELAQLHTQIRTPQPDPAAVAGMEERLAQVRTEVDSARQEKAALETEVRQLGEQRNRLSGEVADLRREVDERQAALQALKREMEGLNAQALTGRTVLESYAAQLRDAEAVATRADEKSIGLPLWFGQPLPPVAKSFDPYRLESEFFSDEPLDARVVTELVAKLPGLDGCLVVQNRGPVLASRLAEHYYEQLRVPNRDYSLLFGRLPNRRDDLRMPEGRVAIYQLENGFMAVTQADHIFMITTSGQPRLKPGMPHKLVTIARELAKMYLPQA
ncbi:MAG: hypothetical protein JOY92_14865 [Verrucomicrobia bacterium]|nr:hypothetical protein [Verrucomicrobiota bacterium]